MWRQSQVLTRLETGILPPALSSNVRGPPPTKPAEAALLNPEHVSKRSSILLDEGSPNHTHSHTGLQAAHMLPEPIGKPD